MRHLLIAACVISLVVIGPLLAIRCLLTELRRREHAFRRRLKREPPAPE